MLSIEKSLYWQDNQEETTVKDYIFRRLSGDKAEVVLAEGRDMNARFQHAEKELKLKSVYLLNKQQRICIFSFFLPDYDTVVCWKVTTT